MKRPSTFVPPLLSLPASAWTVQRDGGHHPVTKRGESVRGVVAF
jgi:hypothetical protein